MIFNEFCQVLLGFHLKNVSPNPKSHEKSWKIIKNSFLSETTESGIILSHSTDMEASYKKGISEKYIKDSISKIKEDESDPDFFSAIKICKKRRIGPCREESNRPLFYKKDIGILARSGFSFEISKKILDIPKDEFIKFCKMLWYLSFITDDWVHLILGSLIILSSSLLYMFPPFY